MYASYELPRDLVDRAVKAHPEGLRTIRRFTTPGQQPGTIYVSDTPMETTFIN